MKLMNILLIGIGLLLVGVGMIGVLVPILPTTPFLILASVCFMRSSERFDKWLRGTKIYKDYAEDFINDRSMTLKRKIKILVIADLMLLFPLIRLDSIYLRLFIASIIVIKYIYFIFFIKTKKE
jgi:hypothetical protein